VVAPPSRGAEEKCCTRLHNNECVLLSIAIKIVYTFKRLNGDTAQKRVAHKTNKNIELFALPSGGMRNPSPTTAYTPS